MKEKEKYLISIITPLYNAEKYILKTIKSVQSQTYTNYEHIIVDDCSTDNSYKLVEEEALKDDRIKLYQVDENGGPAVARNKGKEHANGQFIAFIDSDDLWMEDKLEKQLKFMLDNDYVITSTDYEQINAEGKRLERVIPTKEKMDYKEVLKNCPIGNSTVMYNVEKLGKVEIPIIRKRNDYLLWLTILKDQDYIYGMNEVLGQYRIHPDSISKNKFSLVKYHWHIYRKIEKLSFFYSSYLIFRWGFLKVFRIK